MKPLVLVPGPDRISSHLNPMKTSKHTIHRWLHFISQWTLGHVRLLIRPALDVFSLHLAKKKGSASEAIELTVEVLMAVFVERRRRHLQVSMVFFERV